MTEPFDYREPAVVYEDNHLLVVVKPQNIPSQSDISGDTDMLSVVREYLRVNGGKPGEAFAGLVQRLDRPTGGVMVFAKTSKAAQRLCEELREGRMEKQYLCVTCAQPKNRYGRLTHYLKKNDATNKVMIVPMMTEGSKKAELEYTVLETVRGFSLVKVKLLTGRSHQIRVQMASIGAPLFGDAKYGAPANTCKHKLGLWATQVKFAHPTTREERTFIVYPPKDEVPWKAFNVALHLNVGIAVSPYEHYAEKAAIYKEK